jgi:segregation and condensation protein A
MSNELYEVKLDNIFEGPMDLLIHLIKKNEVDIYDIPIALITHQYLEYLEWMKRMNIDFAGEFIVLAATLTQIKSKMLLPVHEPEEEQEDPRLEITRPLLEYLQMKSAAQQLGERNLLGEHVFARSRRHEKFLVDPDEQMVNVGIFELFDAFERILKNVSLDHRVDLTADRISVKDRMTEIIGILEQKGAVTFDELFAERAQKSEVIGTFLALLEMVKLCLIQVTQHVQTGIIRLFYM